MSLIVCYVSVRYYGPANLLWFSNLSVLLLTASLVTNRSLPASIVLVGVGVLEVVWSFDLALRLLMSGPAMGLTEYVFVPRLSPDEQPRPLWARLVALYHLLIVPGGLWIVWRLGYDRRALRWVVIGCGLIGLGCVLALDPSLNVNRVRHFGPFNEAWLTTPGYFALWIAVLFAFMWWPTHVALSRWGPKMHPTLRIGSREASGHIVRSDADPHPSRSRSGELHLRADDPAGH